MLWKNLTDNVSGTPPPRYGFSTVSFEGKIFLFGGKDGHQIDTGHINLEFFFLRKCVTFYRLNQGNSLMIYFVLIRSTLHGHPSAI